MIVMDANLLLYAYTPTSLHHVQARLWLKDALSGTEIVGIPWQSVLAFLRIGTNARLGRTGRTTALAGEAIDSWLRQPTVRLLSPGEGHWPYFQRMLLDGQAGGDLVTDAHLAALTIEHGGVLNTTDRDFARFPDLRWINPLQN